MDIFILLALFQLKHFISDYPLQNGYMLGKAKVSGWINPLLAHSSVHAIGTFIIVSFWSIKLAVILMFADLILHFTVDRIKTKIGGRFNSSQPFFWWALGLDQMTHHLINYAFIYIIINKYSLIEYL